MLVLHWGAHLLLELETVCMHDYEIYTLTKMIHVQIHIYIEYSLKYIHK